MQKRDSYQGVEANPLVVEYRDPRTLKRYDRNARTHSAEQVRQIRASMDRFGNNNPILLKDDGETVGAGHGRLEAALLEPPLQSVPTITLHALTEAEWRAYVIADNKLAMNAGWDEDLLRLEVSDLLAEDVDLVSLLGFEEAEVTALLATADFEPAGEDEQGRLDEKSKITCPSCSHVFTR